MYENTSFGLTNPKESRILVYLACLPTPAYICVCEKEKERAQTRM